MELLDICSRCGFTTILYSLSHSCQPKSTEDVKKELELLQAETRIQEREELKDQKIDPLKEENLQAELSHKSEELIRTTLNIVRKNEMLMGIKKEVLGISHSISEENLVSSGVKHFHIGTD